MNLRQSSSNTKTLTRHPARKAVLEEVVAIAPMITTHTMKKSQLAAMMPPATLRLDVTKATREQQEHRQSQKKRALLTTAFARIVSTFSPIQTATRLKLSLTRRFLSQQPSLSTSLANTSALAETK